MTRKLDYIYLSLSDAEFKKLRKGYKVNKRTRATGRVLGISISLNNKNRKVQKEIERLKAKIKALQGGTK